MSTLATLSEVAASFRKAIEAVPPNARPIGMEYFPHGACGDATLLLGAYLSDLKINGFKYVCGDRGSQMDNTWTSHAWLQKNTLVIDITADQFADAPAAVVIADPSPWHSTFETEPAVEADFRLWNGFGAEKLHPMYARLMRILKEATQL